MGRCFEILVVIDTNESLESGSGTLWSVWIYGSKVKLIENQSTLSFDCSSTSNYKVITMSTKTDHKFLIWPPYFIY